MELGYEKVYSLQGGYNAWKEAYPELIEKIYVEEEASYEEVATEMEAAGGC